MPGFRGHLLGGAIGYGLLLLITPLANAGSITVFRWLFCVLAGALFPDIDTKSIGQKWFYRVFLVIVLACLAVNKLHAACVIGSCAMIPLMGNHRGLCHNPLMLIFFPLAAAYGLTALCVVKGTALYVDALFFIFGAFTHIFLDRGVAAFVLRGSGKKFKRS